MLLNVSAWQVYFPQFYISKYFDEHSQAEPDRRIKTNSEITLYSTLEENKGDWWVMDDEWVT